MNTPNSLRCCQACDYSAIWSYFFIIEEIQDSVDVEQEKKGPILSNGAPKQQTDALTKIPAKKIPRR